ncbi:hypothetical protein [Ancylobacter sp. IITR112]|uniref:hypothetical protein n=1 Tax=Ancylobacter sp. IITR112 TaxID=3138073 RepID=UPI003529EB1B
MSIFITSTPLAQMRPLGSEGERSHARVTSLLVRYLSPEHAAILADPVLLRDGSGVDWYVDDEGETVPLAVLPYGEAQAVRVQLATLLRDIRAKADEIEAGPGNRQSAAAALRNATLFPGEDCIYALRSASGLRPLIVGWGYEGHEQAARQPFDVSTFAAPRGGGGGVRAAPPPPSIGAAAIGPSPATATLDGSAGAAGAAPAGRFRMLLPLLLTGLLSLLVFGLIIAFLLPACGLRTPFGVVLFGLPPGTGCLAAAPAGGTASLLDDARTLERELAVLQQQYRDRRLACRPAAARPPAPPPAQPDRFDERIDRRGATQITLIWDSKDDLDLSMTCPSGPIIYFARAHRSHCGGLLDEDRNADSVSPSPVENITFEGGLLENGPHRIRVNLYNKRDGNYPIPFTVRIRQGDSTREIPGAITGPGQPIIVGEVAP